MLYQTKVEMLKTLGSNLRALRLSYNISQLAAAERSGISLKTVRNIEGGKFSGITEEDLRRLADRFAIGW